MEHEALKLQTSGVQAVSTLVSESSGESHLQGEHGQQFHLVLYHSDKT
jgi:hypothetical protein